MEEFKGNQSVYRIMSWNGKGLKELIDVDKLNVGGNLTKTSYEAAKGSNSKYEIRRYIGGETFSIRSKTIDKFDDVKIKRAVVGSSVVTMSSRLIDRAESPRNKSTEREYRSVERWVLELAVGVGILTRTDDSELTLSLHSRRSGIYDIHEVSDILYVMEFFLNNVAKRKSNYCILL